MSDFTRLIDLAAGRLGGAVLSANDEFFAPKERLLLASEPVFLEHEYTERGKWMDGWETRRRRGPGCDWCLIRLALRGIVHGVVVDTTFFRGNYPESCSLEACDPPGTPDVETLIGPATTWTTLVSRSMLKGHTRNAFPVTPTAPFTHVRFNIFPDGGVARLRVHGYVVPDWASLTRKTSWVDLAAVEHGGLAIASSDEFFGSPQNLLLPGRPSGISDGWETRRRRGPGHDWAIVKLGRAGVLHRLEVDTTHFKGNAPGDCSIEGCRADGDSSALLVDSASWSELVPRRPLQPHTQHVFESEIRSIGVVTHVRLNIFPDGGVARLRAFGTPSND